MAEEALADVRFCIKGQAFDCELRLANHQHTAADQRDDRGRSARNANGSGYLECRWQAVIHHDRTGDRDERRTGEQSETRVKVAKRS